MNLNDRLAKFIEGMKALENKYSITIEPVIVEFKNNNGEIIKIVADYTFKDIDNAPETT